MVYKRVKKTNKSFLITIGILVLLIIISSQTDTISGAGSNLANTIFKPIEKVTYSISSEIMGQVERTVGSRETRSQVEKLEAENKALEIENARLNTIINKEEFLKEERDAISSSGNQYLKASVVNTDLNSMTSNFTIDKGKKDGVKKNDIILQAIGESDYYTGLVGKITEVFENTARVVTINNEANDVSFINARSNDYGVIDKFTSKTIQGYMLDVDSGAKNSDVLLTSGLGGVYPYGIYIGTISNVSMSQDSLRKNITIDSPVDFNHLYRVLVLSGKSEYQSDETKDNTKEDGGMNE
ncbi:rod shape-determining protein MreC [Anaerococcus sp. Marseille-Q7828]|uniref:rod shape-determining protein MreC n=1 Tax=Anaerococcus sp. Marseille-Q7828 TaxID=3036300 RepID=UPI0024AD0987|nr:rod shape-determining protein MreC [Anaerococcus sp. Marseille-Q7828]